MDPERNIEKWLKRFARIRGDRALDARWDLHPADRRALQEEVRRRFPSGPAPKRSPLFFRPGFLFAVSVMALTGILAAILLPRWRGTTSPTSVEFHASERSSSARPVAAPPVSVTESEQKIKAFGESSELRSLDAAGTEALVNEPLADAAFDRMERDAAPARERSADGLMARQQSALFAKEESVGEAVVSISAMDPEGRVVRLKDSSGVIVDGELADADQVGLRALGLVMVTNGLSAEAANRQATDESTRTMFRWAGMPVESLGSNPPVWLGRTYRFTNGVLPSLQSVATAGQALTATNTNEFLLTFPAQGSGLERPMSVETGRWIRVRIEPVPPPAP